ncbi:MAG: insulinase family protein [Thermoleophilaceae bacterium]|nr:insulinase family protein [Thermoleophilaceae bacterium]
MTDSNHQITTLDNGLRIVTERFENVRSVALSIMVGVGSRNEALDQAGLSHFLEHLLFKGTGKYSSNEIDEFFDSIGAEVNASTNKEVTTVYARFLDRHLENAFDVISEMVMKSTFQDIDAERQVVIEEIAMYEDEPSDIVFDLLGRRVFGDTPLGRRIIGTEEVVGGVSVERIAAYRDSQYVPGNLVIAAAGAVDHDQIVALAKSFGFDRPGNAPSFEVADAPTAPSFGFFKKDTEQVNVALGAPSIARGDERRFAFMVLNTIFGSSTTSRLFQEVREKRGLAYSVYSYNQMYRDTGEVGLYVGTRPDRIAESIEIFARELQHLCDEPATQAEFLRAKENLKGRTALSMESPMGRMMQLGGSVLFDVPILSLDEIEERIQAVTMDDLHTIASEYYAPGRFNVAAVGSDESAIRTALEALNPDLAAAPLAA